MLKCVWTPGVAAAPDAAAYRQAVDTLTVSFGGQDVAAGFPRSGAPASNLPQLAVLLKQWLAARTVPTAAPKLMLHGYSYDPRHVGDASYDPFTSIYGYPAAGGLDARSTWLPLVEECDPLGGRRQETAIAFAWVSTGSLLEYAEAGWSESYQYACVDLVRLAAQALAGLLKLLAAEAVSVDVLAHSLGTRLLTQTVAVLGAGTTPLRNVVLLDGADYAVDAASICAGAPFNVVNVTNEIDSVLVLGAEQAGDPSRSPGSVVALSLGRYGLGPRASWTGRATYPPNWVDIALDRLDVQAWFRAHGGYTLTPRASDNVHPEANLNHWACYTEPGNRAWVTDLLWKPGLNGGALARMAGLPQGILGDSQAVIAGVPIPTSTPMTMAGRMRYQQAPAAGPPTA